MIISIGSEKAFDKIQHSFLMKNQQTKNKRELHQPIKVIYEIPTADIIFNGGRVDAFPLRSGTRQIGRAHV